MRTRNGMIVGILLCVLIGIGAPGCNTFHGAGKDIEKGGQAVEKAANNTEQAIEHPRMHTVTATAESGGRIDPSGGTSVAAGSHPTFLIKANRGHHVADVLVDGKSVGAVSRYTFDNVNEHHTISALFKANQY